MNGFTKPWRKPILCLIWELRWVAVLHNTPKLEALHILFCCTIHLKASIHSVLCLQQDALTPEQETNHFHTSPVLFSVFRCLTLYSISAFAMSEVSVIYHTSFSVSGKHGKFRWRILISEVIFLSEKCRVKINIKIKTIYNVNDLLQWPFFPVVMPPCSNTICVTGHWPTERHSMLFICW